MPNHSSGGRKTLNFLIEFTNPPRIADERGTVLYRKVQEFNMGEVVTTFTADGGVIYTVPTRNIISIEVVEDRDKSELGWVKPKTRTVQQEDGTYKEELVEEMGDSL